MSSRGMPVTKAIRARRRKVAEEMAAAYNQLSLEEKIAKLPPPPAAARQRARLEAQLSARGTTSQQSEKTSKKPKAKKSETA